jgi:hypothetical protein
VRVYVPCLDRTPALPAVAHVAHLAHFNLDVMKSRRGQAIRQCLRRNRAAGVVQACLDHQVSRRDKALPRIALKRTTIRTHRCVAVCYWEGTLGRSSDHRALLGFDIHLDKRRGRGCWMGMVGWSAWRSQLRPAYV